MVNKKRFTWSDTLDAMAQSPEINLTVYQRNTLKNAAEELRDLRAALEDCHKEGCNGELSTDTAARALGL